jgi:hypothetical protein
MRALIDATLLLSLSIALTLLILIVIFPRHALGGGGPELQSTAVQPAVLNDGNHNRPGLTDDSTNPGLAEGERRGHCPYLAALAAPTACPARPGSRTTSPCPYLLEKLRQVIGAAGQPAAPFAQDI